MRNYEVPVVYEVHIWDIYSVATELENMWNENDVGIDLDVMSFETMQDMNMWLKVEVEKVVMVK